MDFNILSTTQGYLKMICYGWGLPIVPQACCPDTVWVGVRVGPVWAWGTMGHGDNGTDPYRSILKLHKSLGSAAFASSVA